MSVKRSNGQVTYSSFGDNKSADRPSGVTYYKEANQNQGNQSNYQDYLDTYQGDMVTVEGVLEMLPDYGILRQEERSGGDETLPKDVYISLSQIKRFALRVGDKVKGQARPPKEGERYLSMLKVEQVEGLDPEEARKRPSFSRLTPIFPTEWMKLETEPDIIATRLIDIISPIGKGQRAMIVAPPKAGKTFLLKDIANGITKNYPDVILMVALIGERPEEVTDMRRSVKGEVFSSNFDEKAENQTGVAEVCLERAKRLAEKGNDVVILMDSLTRLARAYNMVVPPSGRTLSGGFDPSALYPPKHFFGAARKFEEGGSLTIVATALVDTGSKMDDVIFEEFKGTGNMELRLDRSLSERRIWPAIDIKASSTRHEEKLYDAKTLEAVYRLRRMVDLLDDRQATELVISRLKKTKTNQEFLETLHQAQAA
ncbi:MAG: transcription termination factor Rho [bacterium]